MNPEKEKQTAITVSTKYRYSLKDFHILSKLQEAVVGGGRIQFQIYIIVLVPGSRERFVSCLNQFSTSR